MDMELLDDVVRPLLRPIKGWVVFFGALLLLAGEATVLPFDPPAWAIVVLFLVNAVVASAIVDLVLGGTLLGIVSLLPGEEDAG